MHPLKLNSLNKTEISLPYMYFFQYWKRLILFKNTYMYINRRGPVKVRSFKPTCPKRLRFILLCKSHLEVAARPALNPLWQKILKGWRGACPRSFCLKNFDIHTSWWPVCIVNFSFQRSNFDRNYVTTGLAWKSVNTKCWCSVGKVT